MSEKIYFIWITLKILNRVCWSCWTTPFCKKNSYEVLEIDQPTAKFTIQSKKEAAKVTHDLVQKSVLSRSISDVPLGTFLSGGVDSSIVSLCLAQQQEKKIDTFSVGFDKKSFFSERYSNSNKESIFVYPTNQDGIAEVLTTPYKTAGNSVGIPIKQKGGSQSWSDESYDSNIALINQALEVIDNHLGNGTKVVFPSSGLTTILGKEDAQIDVLKDKAPRTYTYLVSELYKKYGYVNPGAESNLGFRKEFNLVSL